MNGPEDYPRPTRHPPLTTHHLYCGNSFHSVNTFTEPSSFSCQKIRTRVRSSWKPSACSMSLPTSCCCRGQPNERTSRVQASVMIWPQDVEPELRVTGVWRPTMRVT